jgi:mannose/fructose/N-acetylgalactosamine-specific phosphotransferase system component IID
MYIVAIAWLYVALMMAVAEATSFNGTVLGAIITFLLYRALPITLVVYVMGTPARRRAIKAKEQAELAALRACTTTASASLAPDTDGQTATDTIPAVRKEP